MSEVADRVYGRHLTQGLVWPSTSSNSDVLIASMEICYAIRCYHVLVEANEINSRSVLAAALLTQAVGEPVVLAQDVPESRDVGDDELTLEECYDIIEALDAYDRASGGGKAHPIARARNLQSLIQGYQKGFK